MPTHDPEQPDRATDSNRKRRRLLQSAGAVALGVGVAGCNRLKELREQVPIADEGGYTAKQSTVETTEISTDEVNQAPDFPDRTVYPPEGAPASKDEFEKLKKKARRGEMPQPPESEIQIDRLPQARFYDSGSVNKALGPGRITIGTEYDGWNSTETEANPADPNIAVGREKTVLAVNTRWGIYDKTTGDREYQVTLKDWFAPLITRRTAELFDPKTLYDHTRARYILMAIGLDYPDSYWLVAVSDDGNPFGTWWIARIDQSDEENWVDYPCLGVDEQAIYLTANMDPWPLDYDIEFQYSRLIIIDKNALYSGGSFTYWSFKELKNPDGTDAFTIQPAHMMSRDQTTYLVNSRMKLGDSLTLWEVVDPVRDPKLRTHDVSVSRYGLPPDARQPDTGARLETWDARLMNAVYENGSVWTAHSISYDWENDGDAEAIVKWYEIDVATRSVVQSRGWGRPNGYYTFPTVASDAESSMMIVYNESGRNTNPRIEVAGRTNGHSKNSLEDVAIVKRGDSGYDSAYDRWGDYNGIVVDPTTDHYWAYSKYALDPNDINEYGTWVGEAFF